MTYLKLVLDGFPCLNVLREHRTRGGPKMVIFSLEVEIDTVMVIIRELLAVNSL